MKLSWSKVAVLFLYVGGALITLAITQGGSSGEAIAFMFAGAAANQGASSVGNGNSSNPSKRSKRETNQ